MQRANSLEIPWCWERLRAGEGGERMRRLDGIIIPKDMSLKQQQNQYHSLIHSKNLPWGKVQCLHFTFIWLGWGLPESVCQTEQHFWPKKKFFPSLKSQEMGDSKSQKCRKPLLLSHQILQTKVTQSLCVSPACCGKSTKVTFDP